MTTVPTRSRRTFPPPASERRGAIVLVHGAWVGEWSWAPVLELLQMSGRAVHPVSLTGHGCRRHQSGPHIRLGDHVDDLVSVMDVHDIEDATVVAHSYGGRVATKAWPRIADRTARLVYLDAHAPVGPPANLDELVAGLAPAVDGMVPFSGFEPDADSVGGEEGLAWFRARIVHQSLATLTEPFATELPVAVDKVYVHATGEPSPRFRGYARAASTSPDWSYHELPGNHWLMATHPDEVARIVLGDQAADPEEGS